MNSRIYGCSKDPFIASLVQSHAGVYKFHRDVFKGGVYNEYADAFDKVIIGLLNIKVPATVNSILPDLDD